MIACEHHCIPRSWVCGCYNMILIFYITKNCSSLDTSFGHLKMSKLSLVVRLSRAQLVACSSLQLWFVTSEQGALPEEKCEGGRQQGPGTCSTRSHLSAQMSPNLNWVRPRSQGWSPVPLQKGSLTVPTGWSSPNPRSGPPHTWTLIWNCFFYHYKKQLETELK